MQNLNHDQTKYTSFVKEIKKQISIGKLQKTIASRPFFADVNDNWQIAHYFQKLVEKYENAFSYLFSIPGIGTWCGATPEMLIDALGKKINLVSLAGTKTQSQEWTDKEREEQLFVTEYIKNQLIKNGCQKISVEEPETIKAGAVEHLKTNISAELNDPQQLYSLVSVLHPTPAVGGFPKNAAIELILEKESYDRKYYTGFLGPVTSNQTKLFVNLRCLESLGDSVCLYLGAGITAASDPDAEWEETKLKAKTLLSVLNDSWLTNDNTKLYCIGGLGTDRTVFDALNIPAVELIVINWLTHRKNETLEDYAKRMANSISFPEDYFLLGVSFGGMLTIEIAKIRPPKKLFLLSSIRTTRELPLFYRIVGNLKSHYLIPVSLLKSSNVLSRFFFGVNDKHQKTFKHILNNTDPHFLRWALDSILGWRNQDAPQAVLIHGNKDKIFSAKNPNYLVDGAGHFMIRSHAEELAQIIEKELIS